MGGENDGVITLSGFGDGTYPAYWGIDKNGLIVSMVLDFMILAKENDYGVLVTI